MGNPDQSPTETDDEPDPHTLAHLSPVDELAEFRTIKRTHATSVARAVKAKRQIRFSTLAALVALVCGVGIFAAFWLGVFSGAGRPKASREGQTWDAMQLVQYLSSCRVDYRATYDASRYPPLLTLKLTPGMPNQRTQARVTFARYRTPAEAAEDITQQLAVRAASPKDSGPREDGFIWGKFAFCGDATGIAHLRPLLDLE